MSYAFALKSMNCISTVGRIPMCAAPAAAPTRAISEIGVSTTRCSPNRDSRPSVTLKAPPYAPMSSPIAKTLGSRSISSKWASRIASRYVISGIGLPVRVVGAPSFRPLVRFHSGALRPEPQRSFPRRIGVHALEPIEGLREGRALGLVGCLIDFNPNALVDGGEIRGVELELVGQPPDVAIDRVVLPLPPLDLAGRDIRLIVVLCVALAAIREELDERDAAAGTGPVDRAFGDIVDGQHVVAVRLVARHAVADGLVDELLGSRLS